VMAGDILLLQGSRDDLEVMAALQKLEITEQSAAQVEELESQEVTVTEAVLSPRTTLAGHVLGALRFRDRYGLTVLAVWREGRPYRSELKDLELRFGDALLVYGPRRQLEALATDPDFVLLDETATQAPRPERAPLAAAIMATVLLAAMLGWAPIAIAVGALGPRAVMTGLFVITVLGTQVMPTAAVVVLISPIALGAAETAAISPYTLMMTVALAASASFATPVAHPAHLLVMGPGGYRFVDYVKVGAPLTAVAFVVIIGLVPLMWTP
jgi:di/tricarboxylate transporter